MTRRPYNRHVKVGAGRDRFSAVRPRHGQGDGHIAWKSRAAGRAPLTRDGIAGRFCRLGLLTGMVSDIASKRSAMLHMRVPPAGKLAVSTSPTRPGFSGRKRWSTHVVQL